VDFGHTFSYGLETRQEADLLHGEAVLLDIIVSTLIALARQYISREEAGRVFQLITQLDIPLDTSLLDPAMLWQSLEERTYHRNGSQIVPMPRGIGNCGFVNDINFDEIETAVAALEDWKIGNYDHA
jgi:3-dehydroquinate synthase